MFSTCINERKNRLGITLGAAETGDGKKLIQQIRAQLEKLSPGFTCISDISNFSLKDGVALPSFVRHGSRN